MSKCQSNNYHGVRKRIKRQTVFEMVHCNLVIKHVHECVCVNMVYGLNDFQGPYSHNYCKFISH